MNERILELVNQADIKFDVSSDNYGVDTATVTPYDLEKFAELIVRECLRIVDENTYGPGGLYDYSYSSASAAADDRATAIYTNIREHFGVK